MDDNPLTQDGEVNILTMKPLNTPELTRTFARRLAATVERDALVLLRDELQELHNRYLATNTRVGGQAHERGRFIPADQYAILQVNIRTLGFRMLQVQSKLSVIRETRRREAEVENRERAQAGGKGEDSLPEMFQSVAAELLSPATYDQLLEAAKARLERRRRDPV